MVGLNPMFGYTADIIKLLQVQSVERFKGKDLFSKHFRQMRIPHSKQTFHWRYNSLIVPLSYEKSYCMKFIGFRGPAFLLHTTTDNSISLYKMIGRAYFLPF